MGGRRGVVFCGRLTLGKVFGALALCWTVAAPLALLGAGAAAGATSPTTSVLVPSSGSTDNGDVWLAAGASSPVGIASVSYEVSGGLISDQVVSSSVATCFGWLGAWDTTDVPNGTYTLQSVATDTLGNSTTSAGIIVTVDNLPLHTEVIIPSNGSTLVGSAILDALASGTSAVTGVQFVVSGGSLSDQVVGTAGPTLYGWIAEWNTTTVSDGTYTLQSVATDKDGNTATSPGITITVANPPPQMILPANGATLSGTTVLDALAQPATPIVVFGIVNEGTGTVTAILDATATIYGWLALWNTTGVANGTYSVTPIAGSSSGPTGTGPPITVTVSN